MSRISTNRRPISRHAIDAAQGRSNFRKIDRDRVDQETGEAQEAIALGQVIRVSAGNQINLARANTSANAQPVGIAIEAMANGHTGAYKTAGLIRNAAWSLTPGAIYYLSGATAGTLVSTIDVTSEGEYVIILGRAQSATEFILDIQQRVRL